MSSTTNTSGFPSSENGDQIDMHNENAPGHGSVAVETKLPTQETLLNMDMDLGPRVITDVEEDKQTQADETTRASEHSQRTSDSIVQEVLQVDSKQDKALRVATLVMAISASAINTAWQVVLQNQAGGQMKTCYFKTCLMLLCATFICSAVLLISASSHRNFQGKEIIMEHISYLTIPLIILAVGSVVAHILKAV